MCAAWALGQLKDPRAYDPLIAGLQDQNEDVRAFAFEALGKLKDPRAVEPLIARELTTLDLLYNLPR